MGLFLLELFNGALSASQALMGLCLLAKAFNGALSADPQLYCLIGIHTTSILLVKK